MKLVWTEPAVASLSAIQDYIARDNAFYAGIFATRLIAAAESLQTVPSRGRIVPEFGRDDVRELLFQHYRIIYRLGGERCEILAVVHGARDLGSLPRLPWDVG